MQIGFIGLGAMGLPMARALMGAGHTLAVYNRTVSRTDELVDQGARRGESPADVAGDADVLITMLADDAAVEDVMLRDGALDALAAGRIHISMSTIGVGLASRLAALHAARGHGYISAPVFGRPAAAEQRKLWVIAAGAPEHIERARPLFDAIGQGTKVVGEEPSMANVVKLAGNFTIAAVIETLGEAFALVRRSGMEAAQFLEIINTALFGSPLYGNYGSIIAGEHFEPAAFKLRLGLKDVRLALAAANAASVPMPLASLLHDNLLAAVGRGKGELDWAGLAQMLAENAGLESSSPSVDDRTA